MKIFIVPCFCIFLFACATAPVSNELQINRDANAVTGSAGADWTDEDLRNNLFRAICQGDGEVVSEMSIDRDSDGKATFEAVCSTE